MCIVPIHLWKLKTILTSCQVLAEGSDAEHARIVCVKARRDERDVVEEIMDDVEEALDGEDVMEEDENSDKDDH